MGTAVERMQELERLLAELEPPRCPRAAEGG
jgi:hypothetical protein